MPLAFQALMTKTLQWHADDLFAVWDESDGATEKVTAGVIRTFMQDGLAGGLQPLGRRSGCQRWAILRSSGRWFGSQPRTNHVHQLPIDNTLEFNAQDELAVNVQDVIEHLQERIQYHTGIERLFQLCRGNRWASLCHQPIPQDSSPRWKSF